jgi:hypothetical protein
VHDLRFAVRTTSPAALEESIAKEGILSDALGNYSTTLRTGEFDVTYTGPLLSDELINSVQNGMARAAHTKPEAVTVSSRSTAGVGVDMANEPAPSPGATEGPSDHNHDDAHDDVHDAVHDPAHDINDAPDDSDGGR